MVQVNEKLKSELFEVINKMDSQIKKFEEKRRAKIEAELRTNAALQDKDQKIKKGAKKYEQYKQEIAEMWQLLETTYGIDQVNKLEDDLKAKTRQVEKLRTDAEAMERISKDQSVALDQMGGKNKENSEKMYQLTQQLREAKAEAKLLKDQHKDDTRYLQSLHEQIMDLETKVKKVTNMIKDQKGKGVTQRSSVNPMSINDDAKLRLEDDLKSLEDLKQTQEKRYKFQVSKLDSQLKHLNHELQILGVKLKEKD